MIQQLQFLCKSIKNPHRDVVSFDGKEMGHPIMTTYHQNAKVEAVNMLHRLIGKGDTVIYCPKNTALSPEEVVLRERAADYNGRELTVNCEAPYSNNRE